MKKQIATIIENANIAKGIWQMKVRFPEAFEVKAGQFVQISLPGKFLRRPISICDMDDSAYRRRNAGYPGTARQWLRS